MAFSSSSTVALLLLSLLLLQHFSQAQQLHARLESNNLQNNSSAHGIALLVYNSTSKVLNCDFMHTVQDATQIQFHSLNFSSLPFYSIALQDPLHFNTFSKIGEKSIFQFEIKNVSTEFEKALLTSTSFLDVHSLLFPNGEIGGLIQNPGYSPPSPSPAARRIPLSWKTWVTLSVVLLMLLALLLEIAKAHFVLFAAMVILIICDIVPIDQAMQGYSNEGMLTVALLFPVVYPLSKNTMINKIAHFIFGGGKSYIRLSLLRMMIPVAILSVFLNNTPIVALFIPIIKDWCRDNNLAPSKFLMPLSFATIVGGVCSLIGTSTNLIANGMLNGFGIEDFGFFELGYVGIPCAALTILYMVTVGVMLLPQNKGGMFRLAREQGKTFLSELIIQEQSPLAGKKVKQVLSKLGLEGLELVEIIRYTRMPVTAESPEAESNTKQQQHTQNSIEFIIEEHNKSGRASLSRIHDYQIERILPVPENEIVQRGDRLVFAGNVESVMQLHSKTGIVNLVNLNEKFTINEVIGAVGEEQQEAPEEQPKPKRKTSSSAIVSGLPNSLKKIITTGAEDDHATTQLPEPPIPAYGKKSRRKKNSLKQRRSQSSEFLNRLAADGSEAPSSSHDVFPEEQYSPRRISMSKSLIDIAASDRVVSPTMVDIEDETQRQTDTSTANTDLVLSVVEEAPKVETTKEPENISHEPEFFEVVIGNQCPIIGKKINKKAFQERYGAVILAARHKGKVETAASSNFLQQVVIQPGDTLLILAKAEFYDKWIDKRDFFVISRCNVPPVFKDKNIKRIFGREVNLWWYGYLTLPIFAAMIIAATAGVPMLKCAMIAATAMILFGFISADKAIQSIDWGLLVMIGASFAIGKAMTISGLAEAFASLLRIIYIPNWLIISVIFLMAQIVTALVTNNAAVAIFLPLSITIAKELGLNPRGFAVAVTIAASADFSTPIGYQTNLMIQGPGGYAFLDYVKVGLPLNIMFWLVCSVLIPIIWKL